MSDEQTDQQTQAPPVTAAPVPAAAPAPVHVNPAVPDWGVAMSRKIDELASSVAKMPEYTVNAIREATQPARQPAAPAKKDQAAAGAAPPKEEPKQAASADEQTPGKKKSFADWWFGG